MLDDYLNGKLSPEFCEKDEEEFNVMPFNLDLEKLGDFDKELDLEYLEFYYDEVEYIAKHFDDEEIEDMDYEEDDRGFDEWMLREEVAADIFNNENVNKVFRELIKTIDINNAYELLCQTYKEMEVLYDEDNYSDEEYEKIFKGKLNNLIKH